MKPRCITCGKKIWQGSKRCKSCENIRRHRLGIASKGKYIDGRTLKDYHCKDCGNRISDYRHKRCKKCSAMFINKDIIRKDKLIYYCKNCNGIIDYQSALYGQGRCKSCEMKHRWQDTGYAMRCIKKRNETMKIKPNYPEKILESLLNLSLKKEYKYVGNGKLFINRFNPDFVNKKNNKIIEMYGDYWHNKPSWKKRDKRRLKVYKEHNYETLIIWQHELEYPEKVIAKIMEFNYNRR